jgi:hypothetical protein
MMGAAIENANKGLNLVPAKNGVSATLSPLTIMTGSPSSDYNELKLEFGAYAQVFEANDPTNTTKARTTGAITLTPTGNNAQGGYHFLSLATGRKLSRQQWDELPIDNRTIRNTMTSKRVIRVFMSRPTNEKFNTHTSLIQELTNCWKPEHKNEAKIFPDPTGFLKTSVQEHSMAKELH